MTVSTEVQKFLKDMKQVEKLKEEHKKLKLENQQLKRQLATIQRVLTVKGK